MPGYEYEAATIFEWVRREFKQINEDRNLTEADKKQLKEFYLQNMIAPKARKLLEKHFPEEFKNSSSTSSQTQRSASPQRTHQLLTRGLFDF